MTSFRKSSLNAEDKLNLATKTEINDLLNKYIKIIDSPDTDDIPEKLQQMFPLNTSTSSILGSKEVISIFNAVNVGKYDYSYSLNDVTVNRLISNQESNTVELDMTFPKDSPHSGTTQTAYRSRKLFLDNFKLDSFTTFCHSMNIPDIALDDIHAVQTRLEDKYKAENRIFRFIDYKNNSYLRSIVSSGYKHYDNYAILYIILVSMENYIQKTQTKMEVSYFYATDSSISLSLIESTAKRISDNVYLQCGINITNSELGNRAARINVTYIIYDQQGNTLTAVGDEIVRIKHNNKTQTIYNELDKLSTLENKKNDIASALSRLSLDKKMNNNEIDYVLTQISGLNTPLINNKVKDDLKNNKTTFKAKKAVTLFDIFNHLKDVTQSNNADPEIIFDIKYSKLVDKIINKLPK